jgi:PTS system nitrogen regulatory IIA component
MSSETMGVDELARYLRRDARELTKLAGRGRLPARKVGGEWRFTRAEINDWIESQLPDYTEEQLQAIEAPPPARAVEDVPEPLLATLLPPACVEVPLAAGTKSSVLRELVRLAEQSWQVYDPEVILEAVRTRENEASTAQEGGVAVPHPGRRLPNALGESVVAFGRTNSGVPFGAPDRGLTDVFFLVLARDDRTHLRVLARLARLVRRPGFLDELRAVESADAARAVIVEAERTMLEL